MPRGGCAGERLGLLVALCLAVLFALPGGAARSGDTRSVQTAGRSEIWVLNQARDRIHIIRGTEAVQEVDLTGVGRGPHLLNFSTDNALAFVASEGDGAITVVRTSDRGIADNLVLFGGTGLQSHQAAPTPDGSKVFVAHRATKTLHELLLDRATTKLARSRQLAMSKTPHCTAFNGNGSKAYVSLVPSGIAVVETQSLTQVAELPTAGGVQCSMVPFGDGTFLVGSDEGAGHLYRLNPANDSLTELMMDVSLGAVERHGLAITPDRRKVLYNSRAADRMHTLDLLTGAVQTISLDIGPGAERPDMIAINDTKAYVTLRAVGKLAVVDIEALAVQQVVDLGGNDMHMVAVLDRDAPRSRITRPQAGRTLKRSSLLSIRGTALDNATFVSSVELALRLKAGKQCSWWSPRRRRLRPGSCSQPVWFPAQGQERWSYRLPGTLPEGSYALRSRATDDRANRETTFGRGRNLITFRLR